MACESSVGESEQTCIKSVEGDRNTYDVAEAIVAKRRGQGSMTPPAYAC